MNNDLDARGGGTFEGRLLQALTDLDARRPAAASPPARPAPRRRLRPMVLATAVVLTLLVVGGASAATAIVLRPDRPDKQLPLGTKTTLRPGERTGIKGMGCRPGSRVTIRLDGRTLGTTTAEATSSIPGVVGWFMAQVTIPSNTPAGTHTLTAVCPTPRGVGPYLKQDRTTITVVRS